MPGAAACPGLAVRGDVGELVVHDRHAVDVLLARRGDAEVDTAATGMLRLVAGEQADQVVVGGEDALEAVDTNSGIEPLEVAALDEDRLGALLHQQSDRTRVVSSFGAFEDRLQAEHLEVVDDDRVTADSHADADLLQVAADDGDVAAVLFLTGEERDAGFPGSCRADLALHGEVVDHPVVHVVNSQRDSLLVGSGVAADSHVADQEVGRAARVVLVAEVDRRRA